MTTTLKIRKIGTSRGVILPRVELKRLGVEMDGGELVAAPVPGGLMLIPANSRLGKIAADALAFMDRYNDTFQDLATR